MEPFAVIFLLLLLLAAIVFWAWMLNDCIMYEPYGAAKAIWIITIVFSGWFGAGIYFLFWRPERRRMLAKQTEGNHTNEKGREAAEGDSLFEPD